VKDDLGAAGIAFEGKACWTPATPRWSPLALCVGVTPPKNIVLELHRLLI
jgi:hypothetical protein